MNDKIPLSVAIITKNEAGNLPGCLKSVAFADQIVVVDSGSTDDTLKIASEFGCDVFIEPWRGFGPQKQTAVDHCKHSWILVLDADERIPDVTAWEIKKIITDDDGIKAGYSFPRKNYFQGRWIKHMGWWPDRIIRLFRKSLGHMTGAKVHESVVINGPVAALDVPIEHYTESRLSLVLMKIDHYTTLAAEEAYKEGRRASIPGAAFRAKLTFFHNYFLRFGFLDGNQGFVLAMTDAINKFFKYAKLNELNKRARYTDCEKKK